MHSHTHNAPFIGIAPHAVVDKVFCFLTSISRLNFWWVLWMMPVIIIIIVIEGIQHRFDAPNNVHQIVDQSETFAIACVPLVLCSAGDGRTNNTRPHPFNELQPKVDSFIFVVLTSDIYFPFCFYCCLWPKVLITTALESSRDGNFQCRPCERCNRNINTALNENTSNLTLSFANNRAAARWIKHKQLILICICMHTLGFWWIQTQTQGVAMACSSWLRGRWWVTVSGDGILAIEHGEWRHAATTNSAQINAKNAKVLNV